MFRPFNDLTGRRFGRWTVLNVSLRPKIGSTQWRCQCDCGKVKKSVLYNGLVCGRSKSCGCLRKELLKKPRDECHSQRNPLYAIWQGMKTRCYNIKHPSYKTYGARGIKICPEWLASYETFARDMGKRPSRHYSIERKDNDGDYTPQNCIWATRTDQACNRRGACLYRWKKKDMNLAQIARMENVDYHELRRIMTEVGMPLWRAIRSLQKKGRVFTERALAKGAPPKVNKSGKTRVTKNHPLYGIW